MPTPITIDVATKHSISLAGVPPAQAQVSELYEWSQGGQSLTESLGRLLLLAMKLGALGCRLRYVEYRAGNISLEMMSGHFKEVESAAVEASSQDLLRMVCLEVSGLSLHRRQILRIAARSFVTERIREAKNCFISQL